MSTYDSVDAHARERSLPEGREDWCTRGRAAVEERAEEPNCLAPEGAGPPLVPFAVQPDAGSLEIKVADAQVCGLLGSCTGVVEEEDEGAIS